MTVVTDRRPWTPVPLARGARGAVVAPHHLATAAGLARPARRRLGRGCGHRHERRPGRGRCRSGCGIGGDAFWLIWDQGGARQTALNGSGRSAAAADRPQALRDRGLATDARGAGR